MIRLAGHCTCQFGRDHDGSEFGLCPFCEAESDRDIANPEKEEEPMSKYYTDKGAHRTFRYEARGDDGVIGYALGSYRTKAEAYEAVLRDKEKQEIYGRGHFGRHCYDD